MPNIHSKTTLTSDERTALPLWLQSFGLEAVHRNSMWVFIEGTIPELGAVEFALPTAENDTGQGDQAATSALALIGHMNGEDFQEARFRITGYDRDLYKLRVGEGNFIPLGDASKFPYRLRTLLGYAYAAEAETGRPFFPAQVLNKKGIRDYEFGHTIRGSFVITVRSPAHGRKERITQRELDFDAKRLAEIESDAELELPEYVLPVTRRVSERLERSLSLIEEVAASDSKEPLYSSYTDSLNAGMSTAIAEILDSAQEPVAFQTLWSPKFSTPEDVQGDSLHIVKPFMAPELHEAAEELRKRHPEVREVRLLVTGMESDSPPLAKGGSRTIFARWMDKKPRPIKIQIHVEDPELYRRAQTAHNEWRITLVRGTLHENRGRYLLTDVERFGDYAV